MNKHTPGPWHIEPLNGKYYGTRVILGNGVIEVWTSGSRPLEPSEREIADGWTPDFGFDHVESAEDYANACLISAAPELLDALREMIADANGEATFEQRCGLLDRARAAIRKATGEE